MLVSILPKVAVKTAMIAPLHTQKTSNNYIVHAKKKKKKKNRVILVKETKEAFSS